MKILQCIITVRQAKYYSISTVYRHRAVVNACVFAYSGAAALTIKT